MAKSNPFTFLQEVQKEVKKVVWPTQRETIVTTIMVFIMVLISAIFFLAADQIFNLGVGYLLQIGQ